MAQALQYHPYQAVIREILALGELPAGWNSYRAPRVTEQAQLQAVRLVNRFPDLGLPSVPAPDVGPSPVGGVVLRWVDEDREVEIHFIASGGEYSVTRRKGGGPIEGDLQHLDPLKDVVGAYVVGRRPFESRRR